MRDLINVLLADDDRDDCLLFEEALGEIPFDTQLSIVNDGDQLLSSLLNRSFHPDVLFLDLNMPRKNGFDCLKEIVTNPQIDTFPIVIFSTSFDQDIIKLLHTKGAHLYVRKPDDFTDLKKVIVKALGLMSALRMPLEEFVVRP
jgi:CheY-like chemotaxis protein